MPVSPKGSRIHTDKSARPNSRRPITIHLDLRVRKSLPPPLSITHSRAYTEQRKSAGPENSAVWKFAVYPITPLRISRAFFPFPLLPVALPISKRWKQRTMHPEVSGTQWYFWDTGGHNFALLKMLRWCVCLVAQLCLTLCDPMDSSVHGDSPGQSPGVGCHVLLQGIFPTQGSNPHLLHCRQILYHLTTKENG